MKQRKEARKIKDKVIRLTKLEQYYVARDRSILKKISKKKPI